MPLQHDDELRDPVVEAYKAGVDRTLLRESLGRTCEERLADLVALVRFADAIRGAARARERSEP